MVSSLTVLVYVGSGPANSKRVLTQCHQKGRKAMSKKNLKIHLLIVDQQNDFMGNDDGSPLEERLVGGKARAATLAVKVAVADMRRLADLIGRVGRTCAVVMWALRSGRRS